MIVNQNVNFINDENFINHASNINLIVIRSTSGLHRYKYNYKYNYNYKQINHEYTY